MPSCFQLVRKDDPEAGPVKLGDIDREICQHFGVEVDDKYWYHDWYDYIGFRLATGKSFEEIHSCINEIEDWDSQQGEYEKGYWFRMKEIADFLNDRFKSHAFYERK